MGIISKTFTMLSTVMDYPVIYSISYFCYYQVFISQLKASLVPS